MVTIDKSQDVLTLINVFTVEPANQQALVDLLIKATNQTMKNQPGFVSANIHRSEDGTRVVNYAQWRDRSAFEAMRKNPDAIPHMQAAAKLAKFEPILCSVAESVSRE